MIDVNELIEYNKDLLVNTYYNMCKQNPKEFICKKVMNNTIENWRIYLEINQFNKGINRLETWNHINQQNPFIYVKNNSDYKFIPPKSYQYINELNMLKKEELYFILAGLIIIFQVFGDGNHRTADYFYKRMLNKNISQEQFKKINNILNNVDYNGIIERDPAIIKNIIRDLLVIHQNGGKHKKRNVKSSKNLIKSIK
jgi:hypothetical protein